MTIHGWTPDKILHADNCMCIKCNPEPPCYCFEKEGDNPYCPKHGHIPEAQPIDLEAARQIAYMEPTWEFPWTLEEIQSEQDNHRPETTF